MVNRCPYCGHPLERPIRHGIKSCSHCRAFFEATPTNKLLGAAWELRKSHTNSDQFKFFWELTDEEANFLYQHVVEEGYTHDEMLKLLSA
jgi:hypothetical protein